MRPVCLPEKYEILGTLGSGGMGTVWHARDRALDREVALKVLSDKCADDPAFVQRFTTEARAAASLNHPNIVQIYEFGQTGGGHYLAMELVDGPSIKEELKRRGRFTESQTVGMARQACAALAVAHAAGIVHRDIKPDNMMLTREGRFKLVDLGLAKRLSEEFSQTVTGQSMGTPHFISPEQILGRGEIDARADIYSLGATMYYLASGTVPFDGTSGPHIMSRHLNDPLPDPRLAVPELSADFCRLIGRMMAKEPADRYQTVVAVDVDLQHLQRGIGLVRQSPVPTALQETIFLSSPDFDSLAPSVTWDEEDLTKMTEALARRVGPLARVLVRNARQQARSRAQLIDILVTHLATETDREEFRAKCDRLSRGEQTTSIATDADAAAAAPGSSVSNDTPTEFSAGPAVPEATVVLGPVRGEPRLIRPPVLTLDAPTRAAIVRALAEHIGPIASVLVKREAAAARDLADLTDRLANAVPSAVAKQTFRTAMQAFARSAEG